MTTPRDNVLDVFPVESERLTATQFTVLVRDNPGIIKSSKIVPPTLGQSGFGAFDVVYSRPLYRTVESKKCRETNRK